MKPIMSIKINESTTPSIYSVIFHLEGNWNSFLSFKLMINTIKNQKMAQNKEKL